MSNIQALWALVGILFFGFAVLVGFVGLLGCRLKKKEDAVNKVLQTQLDCVSDGGHYWEFVKQVEDLCIEQAVTDLSQYLYRCKCGKELCSYDPGISAQKRRVKDRVSEL